MASRAPFYNAIKKRGGNKFARVGGGGVQERVMMGVGGILFFIRSQYISPTAVGAKGRAGTLQQPAPFYLTLNLTYKILHSCACMESDRGLKEEVLCGMRGIHVFYLFILLDTCTYVT